MLADGAFNILAPGRTFRVSWLAQLARRTNTSRFCFLDLDATAQLAAPIFHSWNIPQDCLAGRKSAKMPSREDLFALAGQFGQLERVILADSVFFCTEVLLMSYPLPLSIPGTFLKTVPQAPNQANFACREHFFALAGQLSKLDGQTPADFGFWSQTSQVSHPLPLSSPGTFRKTVLQAPL